MTVRDVFHFTAVTVLVGWVLVVGQTVILPFVVAIMLTYVLIGAVSALQANTPFGYLPVWLSYLATLMIFGAALVTISLIAVSSLRDIAQTELAYEEQALEVLGRVGGQFGLENLATWSNLRDAVINRVDLPDLSLNILASIASIGGYTLLIATYVIFMVAERAPMRRKVDKALPDRGEGGAARALFGRINEQIVTYLSTKTLVNVVLGAISFVIMWAIGIGNAVFWAFVIGLFNYIPYIGSLVAVAAVVIYTAFLTGSLPLTAISLVLLSAAQIYVGNWLEPRLMARTMNLSPLTVIMALVLWSSLWSVPGAIIAVPMTSICLIILAQFSSTRPLAVLASRNGNL